MWASHFNAKIEARTSRFCGANSVSGTTKRQPNLSPTRADCLRSGSAPNIQPAYLNLPLALHHATLIAPTHTSIVDVRKGASMDPKTESVLIATLGSKPQIITLALDLLRDRQTLPVEVIVVHTW